jgi:hypothetical protein
MTADQPEIDADNRKGVIPPYLVPVFHRIRSLWTRIHRFHFFWETAFAVLLAVYFAYYYAGFDHGRYKLYVLIGDDIPNTVGEAVRNRLKQPAQGLKVDGIDVDTEIIDIPANSPEYAITTAWSLVKKRDALLIVGILDSQPTEHSLPIYFHARPQVPFIAAVQSNNDLLRNCDTCFDANRPVPLLQLSPTNADQAKWAVKFAIEQMVSDTPNFLIVSDDRSPNATYVEGLAKAYDKEIPATDSHLGASISSVRAAFSQTHPDCILYAGDAGNAKILLSELARAVQNVPAGTPKWLPTVVLSDTAVPATFQAVTYERLVNLTDQSDAAYYTDPNQPNAYALDAVTIAVYILRELDERGFDWRYSLKSNLLNHTSAEDIRRNIVRIMREDSKFHSSYRGANDTGPVSGLNTVYTFNCPSVAADGSIDRRSNGSVDYCQRYGGIFHVWKWDPQNKAMSDVDPWHPRKVAVPRQHTLPN